MAYQSKSGKSFTNANMARQDDMRNESKPMGKIADPEMDDNDMESQEPSAVVAAHGPAHTVLIKHIEGKHKVKSKHEDGHTHESEHESADDAWTAGKQLSGTGEGAESEDEMGSNPSMMNSNVPAIKGLTA